MRWKSLQRLAYPFIEQPIEDQLRRHSRAKMIRSAATITADGRGRESDSCYRSRAQNRLGLRPQLTRAAERGERGAPAAARGRPQRGRWALSKINCDPSGGKWSCCADEVYSRIIKPLEARQRVDRTRVAEGDRSLRGVLARLRALLAPPSSDDVFTW